MRGQTGHYEIFIQKYRIRKNYKQLERAFNYAQECEPIYLPFIKFCKNLYNIEIVGIKVKRSANEYIKEFKRFHSVMPVPGKVWVYRMAHSPNYSFKTRWLVKRKWKNKTNKNTHEQVKTCKYNNIETRGNKGWLRSFLGNFEIDSVIGKRSDNSALATMIDKNSLKINTITMDNDGENNQLHTIII